MKKSRTKIPFNALTVLLTCILAFQASSQAVSIDPTEIVSVLPEDAVRSIDHPRFLQLPEADGQMSDKEPVLGIKIGNEAKAYPVYLLSAHEIVNDSIAGTGVVVTW